VSKDTRKNIACVSKINENGYIFECASETFAIKAGAVVLMVRDTDNSMP
jgi:hypothetical protein